jgi:hypothetical protein
MVEPPLVEEQAELAPEPEGEADRLPSLDDVPPESEQTEQEPRPAVPPVTPEPRG